MNYEFKIGNRRNLFFFSKKWPTDKGNDVSFLRSFVEGHSDEESTRNVVETIQDSTFEEWRQFIGYDEESFIARHLTMLINDEIVWVTFRKQLVQKRVSLEEANQCGNYNDFAPRFDIVFHLGMGRYSVCRDPRFFSGIVKVSKRNGFLCACA